MSSQAFIDYESGSSVYDQTWSWDDFFYYMAWSGLQETQQFQEEIVNKERYFQWYTLEGSEREGKANKCN